MIGCPALEELGGSLDFSHRAKVSFTYVGDEGSEVSEELYSDTETGVAWIFEAMTSCPTYRVLGGSTSVTVTAQKALADRLGDEQ
ncbi:hypothetical protein [Streptomyces hebeiensis]